MREINYNHSPRTFSQVIIACLVSTQLSFPIDLPVANNEGLLFSDIYSYGGNQATYDRFTASLSKDHSIVASFEEVVSEFYSRLWSKQEPLGMEFEKILHDNLWDLYEN